MRIVSAYSDQLQKHKNREEKIKFSKTMKFFSIGYSRNQHWCNRKLSVAQYALSVYGKTTENVRKHVNVKLMTKWEGKYGAEALITKPNFRSRAILSENLKR